MFARIGTLQFYKVLLIFRYSLLEECEKPGQERCEEAMKLNTILLRQVAVRLRNEIILTSIQALVRLVSKARHIDLATTNNIITNKRYLNNLIIVS